jgi:hypothetical protein
MENKNKEAIRRAEGRRVKSKGKKGLKKDFLSKLS